MFRASFLTISVTESFGTLGVYVGGRGSGTRDKGQRTRNGKEARMDQVLSCPLSLVPVLSLPCGRSAAGTAGRSRGAGRCRAADDHDTAPAGKRGFLHRLEIHQRPVV